MDILTYINKMNRLYGSESQVAGGKGFGSVISEEFDELSPREEQYYQQGPFSTREDFLAAKGGSVYDTRKYFKPEEKSARHLEDAFNGFQDDGEDVADDQEDHEVVEGNTQPVPRRGGFQKDMRRTF